MGEFEIDKYSGVLTVSGQLRDADVPVLQGHCDELLRGPSNDMKVDLTRVTGVSSSCAAVIAALQLDAITIERELTVKASEEVRRSFELAGFGRVVTPGDQAAED